MLCVFVRNTAKGEKPVNNMNNWIEHLQHPLVLAGFGLFIFAMLLRPLFLNNKKISGAGMERLLRRGINFVFILALLAIIGGIGLSWKEGGQGKVPAEKTQPVSLPNSDDRSTGTVVDQATLGPQSPAINSGKEVRINYGPAPTESKKPADAPQTLPEKTKTEPAQVKQTTQGEQSPAINAQGSVEIHYGK